MVRFGVAPDHPEVKNVINSFSKTANSNRVSFIGNVSIGSDITLGELRDIYDAVVLCYGSARERKLNIPGEDLPNVISARKFVGWYNGVPADQDLAVQLNGKDCIVIGQGNVALDCARILLSPVDRVLGKTDITNCSLKLLEKSQITSVHLIGRRGPIQVAFTIKELRELTKIMACEAIIEKSNKKDFDIINSDILQNLPRARRRLTELLLQIADGKFSSEKTNLPLSKRCSFHFLLSPKEIRSTNNNSLVISFDVNKLTDPLSESSKIIATGEVVEMETNLIIKSLGYTTVALDPSLPMDERKGCIKNENGRITDCGNGLYCSGWAATGPVGVLASTMNVSFEVAKNILEDFEKQVVKVKGKGKDDSLKLLKDRGVRFVTFKDWEKIDEWERRSGQALNKPREKLTDVNTMMDIIKESK